MLAARFRNGQGGIGRALALLLAFACLPLPGKGEDFERIGVDDGLPSATVYGVVQDRTGFLWVSGATGGLTRFDGHEFRFFPLLDRAEADGILPDSGTLVLDSQDRLWIGTWGHGAFVLDRLRGEVRRYQYDPGGESSLASDRVQAFHETPDGAIWIGSTGGLNRVAPDGDIERFSEREGGIRLGDRRVWSIAGDHRDRLWVGTSDGLYEFHWQTGTTVAYQIDPDSALDEDDRSNEIRTLLQAPDGVLWVGTRSGLRRFESGSGLGPPILAPAAHGERSPLPPVNTLIPLSSGDMLAGTQSGVFRIDPRARAVQPFSPDLASLPGLPGSNVRALHTDRSGVLWAATREQGLYRRIPGRQRFQTLRALVEDLPAGLERGSATALHVDAAGMVWLGTANSVVGIDPRGRSHRSLRTSGGEGVPGPVSAIASDSAGRLWIASQQGLFLRRPGQEWVERILQPFLALQIKGESIRGMHLAADGSLWLGLWGRGALRWHPDRNESTWLLDDLGDTAGDAVVAFAEGGGRRFVGTRYSGLFEFDAEGTLLARHEFDPERLADSLPNNAVNDLLLDSKGALWVATDQGLARRSPGGVAFSTFNVAQGLPDQRVEGIHEDAEGHLWVLTKRGLARLDPDSGEVVVFTRNDGLLASEFNRGVVGSDREGRLLVGTAEGINLFRPSQVVANSVGPHTALTDARIDGQVVPWSLTAEGTPRLLVEHGKRSLSIGFVALDFQDVKRNRFRYRLIGFGSDWQDAGTLRQATYTNLPQGLYRFEVSGSNNHNRWSLEPAVLEVVVQGPWWLRPWAQATVVSGILALAFVGYRFRLHQHSRARLELERQVASYAGELRAERDLFVGGPAVALIARLQTGWPLSYLSANALTLLGYTPQKLVESGQPLLSLVHPDDRDGLVEQAGLAQDRGESSWEQRFRIVRADGEVRGVLGFAVLQRDESSRPVALRGYLLDQTELLAAQQASEQFKRTLDRTLDAVCMFHADSLELFYVNQGMVDQLGHPREVLLQMRAFEISESGSEENLRQQLAQLIRSGNATTLQTQHRHADGRLIPVEVFLQYVAPAGERARFVVFARDISERMRVEKLKGEFVATVSHELRTPLTSIHGALGLILGGAMGELAAPSRTLLEVAQRNAQRLRMLIDDLLDIEKLEAGQLSMSLSLQAILPLIEQSLEANREYAAQWGVRLLLAADVPDDLVARVDAPRLQQVMSNLLSNAAKFSPPGGEVRVAVRRVGQQVRVEVSDDGPGIPPEFQPRVFDKFSQADASDTRQKGGTGLGLAITRELVQRMGGQIRFRSVVGQGTCFTVEFPCMESS